MSGDTNKPNGEILKKLQELYQGVQEEVIPDRFLDLLEQLDEAEEAAATLGANDKPAG